MTETKTSAPTPQRSTRTRINVGLGRLLIFVYGLFTLSAGARAGVQIATKFSVAPMAYTLSAVAAVIYLIATICLARSTPRSRRIALISCSIELIGVISVGIWSVVDRSAFPDLDHSTVWSNFGVEYAFFPLLLPILGLWWLWRAPQRDAAASQNISQMSA